MIRSRGKALPLGLSVGGTSASDPVRPASVRRNDIQGLRAVAVLAVLIFHATDVIPGGFVGVDVFFVISGYVITMMLAREYQKHGRIRFGNFYLRRLKRLSPALSLVLVFTLVGTAVTLSPLGSQETVAHTAVGAVFLVANVVILATTGGYFGAAAEHNPLLHTWSLAVEEQFYLAFPALLALCWLAARRAGGRWKIPLWIVGTVGVVSFGFALLGSLGQMPQFIPESLVGFYGPAARVWEFAAGALLALGGSRLEPTSAAKATLLGALGAILTGASLFLITPSTVFPGPWTLLPVAGTGLLLAAGAQLNNPVSAALSTRPLVLVGDLSYSLYLWHWPFIVFATMRWPDVPLAPTVAALASVLPAWLSFRFLEEPIRVGSFNRRGLLVLITATISAPLLVAAALWVANDNAFWDDEVRRYQAAITTPHEGSEAGCTTRAWEKLAACTWNATAHGSPIYLVGDSNADHLSEAILKVGEEQGRPVVVSSQIGCTFANVTLVHPTATVADLCNSFVQGAHEALLQAEPGVVVIANAHLWWVESSEIEVGIAGETPTSDPIERLDVLQQGLSTTVEDLQAVGHRVVIVQVIPFWGDGSEDLSWSACSVTRIESGGCQQSFPLGEATSRQEPVWDVLDFVSRQYGAELVDLASTLCPGGRCESETTGGMIRYRDGTHITVEQSEALAPVFSAVIESGG